MMTEYNFSYVVAVHIDDPDREVVVEEYQYINPNEALRNFIVNSGSKTTDFLHLTVMEVVWSWRPKLMTVEIAVVDDGDGEAQVVSTVYSHATSVSEVENRLRDELGSDLISYAVVIFATDPPPKTSKFLGLTLDKDNAVIFKKTDMPTA